MCLLFDRLCARQISNVICLVWCSFLLTLFCSICKFKVFKLFEFYGQNNQIVIKQDNRKPACFRDCFLFFIAIKYGIKWICTNHKPIMQDGKQTKKLHCWIYLNRVCSWNKSSGKAINLMSCLVVGVVVAFSLVYWGRFVLSRHWRSPSLRIRSYSYIKHCDERK